MIKVLLIDNYDSFTFNLVHYLRSLDCEVTVWRNDEFYLDEVEQFENIVLSPGPGLPSENGLLIDVIKKFAPTKNILGVCLGHQAIAEVFGGSLKNLQRVYHGESSEIQVVDLNDSLFKNLPEKFEVGRYHSWAIDQLGNELIATSYTADGEIMSLRHSHYSVCGVQFHPESILSPYGFEILKNWVETCK